MKTRQTKSAFTVCLSTQPSRAAHPAGYVGPQAPPAGQNGRTQNERAVARVLTAILHTHLVRKKQGRPEA